MPRVLTAPLFVPRRNEKAALHREPVVPPTDRSHYSLNGAVPSALAPEISTRTCSPERTSRQKTGQVHGTRAGRPRDPSGPRLRHPASDIRQMPSKCLAAAQVRLEVGVPSGFAPAREIGDLWLWSPAESPVEALPGMGAPVENTESRTPGFETKRIEIVEIRNERDKRERHQVRSHLAGDGRGNPSDIRGKRERRQRTAPGERLPNRCVARQSPSPSLKSEGSPAKLVTRGCAHRCIFGSMIGLVRRTCDQPLKVDVAEAHARHACGAATTNAMSRLSGFTYEAEACAFAEMRSA